MAARTQDSPYDELAARAVDRELIRAAHDWVYYCQVQPDPSLSWYWKGAVEAITRIADLLALPGDRQRAIRDGQAQAYAEVAVPQGQQHPWSGRCDPNVQRVTVPGTKQTVRQKVEAAVHEMSEAANGK